MRTRRIADSASAWTVVVSVLHGETVAAGNWPSYDEAMEWAQRVNRNELGWVRFVAPLVSARDLMDELERGMWR